MKKKAMDHTKEKMPELDPNTEDKVATKYHTPQDADLPKYIIIPHSTIIRYSMLHQYPNNYHLKIIVFSLSRNWVWEMMMKIILSHHMHTKKENIHLLGVVSEVRETVSWP